MSTIKKIVVTNEEDSLSIAPFRIEIENNDSKEVVNVAIHDESAQIDEDQRRIIYNPKSYKYQVDNDGTFDEVKDERIHTPLINAQSGRRKAIHYFTIPFSKLKTGKNTISFFVNDNIGNINAFIGKIGLFLNEESNVVNIKLERPGIEQTKDQALWEELQRQKKISEQVKDETLQFNEYEEFINTILCNASSGFNNTQREKSKVRSSFIRSDEYNLIKFATDFYMLAKFGLDTTQLSAYLKNGKLPYYDIITDRIKDDLRFSNLTPRRFPQGECEEREFERVFNPVMVELIWSYWMEQGMLVQTMNVINLRFQNVKGNRYLDRLQRFDADPLRPLSHILWGYIQDEQHRLSLPRRINEYDHEYGLSLTGDAVPRLTPVDSRVQFLEAFHNLLNLCTIYFRESDETTRIADAFPILNALKEVHLLLAEGNHNAYGNLTWTARQEMMIQQYILSRPEMREFLGGKIMVPYPETWMDRVDTMRNIQGWGGAGIVHYYELAVHGELILLSIRYGNWSDVRLTRNSAANWAQDFRNSIQRYIHAYRSVTGVDLSAENVQLIRNFATDPSFLISQRVQMDKARARRA